MDAFTKRNHYNPCFWTALWNLAYFEARLSGAASGPARAQRVFALSIQADKVYPTIVDKVHFVKGLGVAEITPASMKDFCRRRFPDKYDELAAYVEEHPESLYLDFEDILTAVENMAGYESLIEVALSGGFSSAEHKGFVTCHLMMQAMRSYELMTSMIEFSEAIGINKWEYFWTLKNAWGNQYVLARATIALASARWTLYRTENHRFPLCDSPVMIGRDSLMAVLSPRLLVEIDLRVSSPEEKWVVRDGISFSKYREFRRRSIGNTFREVIFHDEEELATWRSTPEFKARARALAGPHSQHIVADAANRVIWGINGFGRVPRDFERWIRQPVESDPPLPCPAFEET